MTNQPTRPKPGDAVRLTGAYWGANIGAIGIIDGDEWGLCDDGEYLVCFNASAFRGPSSIYAKDQTPLVSCSGGPLPLIRAEQLRPTGMTHYATFWRWKDRPRADGGERYQMDVPLWEWDGETVND